MPLVVGAALLLPSLVMAADLFSSIDSVAAELKAGDATRRRDAVDKLDAYGADEARPLLLKALGDVDPDVRAHAATAIGRHHLADAVPRLLQGLGDADARQRAAEVLGRLGEARAVVPLLARLGDTTREVRAAALDALAQLGDARTVPA